MVRAAHMPWLARDGVMWLVPDTDVGIDDEPSFALTGGRLRDGFAPWESVEDRALGLQAAAPKLNPSLSQLRLKLPAFVFNPEKSVFQMRGSEALLYLEYWKA